MLLYPARRRGLILLIFKEQKNNRNYKMIKRSKAKKIELRLHKNKRKNWFIHLKSKKKMVLGVEHCKK